MPSSLILSIIGYAIAAVGIMGSIYSGFHHIKNIGYQEATVKYTLIIKDYETKRDEKIDSIVKMSGILVINEKANQEATEKGIATILAATKNKPLVIVKNGECIPSPTFSTSIITINKRINESIQENHK